MPIAILYPCDRDCQPKLVEENIARFDVASVRLGRAGVAKQICLGFREADAEIDYLAAFVAIAKG
jgi:LysR family transcriptional regulator for metE and metH